MATKNNARLTKPKRERSKTSLPPRVTAARDRGPDVKLFSVDGKNIDFASADVVKALEAGGWNWAAEVLMRDAESRGVILEWPEALRQAAGVVMWRPVFSGNYDVLSAATDSALDEAAAAQLGTVTDVISVPLTTIDGIDALPFEVVRRNAELGAIAEKNQFDQEIEMTVLNNEICVATIEYAGDKRHQKAAHNFGKRWQQRNFKEQAKGFATY